MGNCGTGFDELALKELYKKFKPHSITSSPLNLSLPRAKVQWLEPKIVCQVRFSERTRDGILRHPVYLGLRKDKKAKEVFVPEIRTTHELSDNETSKDQVKNKKR